METAAGIGTVEANGAVEARFEACERFHPGDDALVCECGWLEHDHGALARMRSWRHGRRRLVTMPARRAS
jgi:hypothetical protein